MEARIIAHNKGKGAKYTRGRSPVRLLAVFEYGSRSEASKAEYAVKQLDVLGKQELIAGRISAPLCKK